MGAYDPPHLIGGNPLAMTPSSGAHRSRSDEAMRRRARVSAGSIGTRNVLKVRTDAGDVDMARDLVRAGGARVAAGSSEHRAGALL